MQPRIFAVLCVYLLFGYLLTASASAQEMPTSVFNTDAQLSSAFTYQGQISNGGNLINGTCDFEFRLWDAATGGTQIGSAQKLSAINVTNGLFSTVLDFANNIFTGEMRYLETALRCGHETTPTTLSPRQPLYAVPYALGLRSGVHVGIPSNYAELATSKGLALYGVYGYSSVAYGVSGNTEGGIGVLGDATTGTGIFGHSQSGIAIKARSSGAAAFVAENSSGGDALRTMSADGKTIMFSVGSDGVAHTKAIQINGGSDLAERFAVPSHSMLRPGTLLVIDEEHPGQLRPSTSAYDTKIAGIISGAGGVQPGMTLEQEGMLDGDAIVAIGGRVYVWAEALANPIKPGDLLTSSPLTGHAMKAIDPDRMQGAIIGKAMSVLDKETGLVLVLVNLQ